MARLLGRGTASSTITVNNLTVAGTGAELLNAGSGTWTLSGNLNLEADETMVRAANGTVTVAANLSGLGSMLLVNNTVTLSGNNAAFTGKTVVGDGRFSGLSIDSEARLGANPTNFVADQLTLNRGRLYSGNLTIDDANRGIRIGVSAGLFNVSAGTTTTIAVPLSSPASGSSLVTTPLYPNPVSGMLIKENTGTLVLTHPNNSHVGEININAGSLTVSGTGRLNNGDQAMPIVNSGTLTFSTTADQMVSGAISGTGPLIKSSTGTLTLSGANTFSGAMTVSGGKLLVNGVSTGAGVVTVANGATLGGSGSVGGSVTVQSGATMSPGTSIGTFTANGSVILQAGSTNFMEINRSTVSSDKLVAGGTLTLGGSLLVTNLAGTLAYGDTFTLFQAGTISGSFSTISLPTLAAGLKWDTNSLVSGII
ncbi:MAG: autotransporter-associated beta strand repeat-containing protein, partial [Verrucomicrobiota bacterium]